MALRAKHRNLRGDERSRQTHAVFTALRDKRRKQAQSEPRPTPPSSFSGESKSEEQHTNNSARVVRADNTPQRDYNEWLLQVRRRKRELKGEIERHQARLNEVTKHAAERNKLIAKRKAEALA